MNKPDASAEILVVEDDTEPLNTLAYGLKQKGHRLERASNESETMKLLRQRRPDLVLLDLTLFGESGIRVCERMRQEDGQVSIILISDKGREEDKVRGFEAGADDYVVRPFSDEAFETRISANLKRRRFSLGTRGKLIEAGDLSIRRTLGPT